MKKVILILAIIFYNLSYCQKINTSLSNRDSLMIYIIDNLNQNIVNYIFEKEFENKFYLDSNNINYESILLKVVIDKKKSFVLIDDGNYKEKLSNQTLKIAAKLSDYIDKYNKFPNHLYKYLFCQCIIELTDSNLKFKAEYKFNLNENSEIIIYDKKVEATE